MNVLLMVPHELVVLSFCLLGPICGIVDQIGKIIGDIVDLITNPIAFVLNKIWGAGNCVPTDSSCSSGFGGFLRGGLFGTLTGPYARAFDAMKPTGLVIAGLAGIMRIVKGMYDDRVDGVHLWSETLVRFGFVFLVLGPPGAPSVAWIGMNEILNIIPSVSADISNVLGSASVWGGGQNPMQSLMANMGMGVLGTAGLQAWAWIDVICLVIVLIVLLYISGLMLLRVCMLTFAVCLSPVMIATAAYDVRNRFFQWWSELFIAVLVMPIVVAVNMTVTAGVAEVFAQQFPGITGLLIDTVVICLGGWFLGKLIHTLTWKNFSHGGVTGALTAASTTVMAIPNMANDVRALAAASGMKIKAGGFLDKAASVASLKYGLNDWNYRGGSKNPDGGGVAGDDINPPGPPGGEGGGGGGPAAPNLAGDLSDVGKIGGFGAAPSFNSFGSKVLGSMGPAGASVAANWSRLDAGTRANIANAIVDSGAFAAGDVGAGANAAQPHVDNAASQLAAMNAANQARANQAEADARRAEDEAKKARWAAQDAMNTPMPGSFT